MLNLPNKPVKYLAGSLPLLSALQSGVLKELIDKNSCGEVYTDGRRLAALCGKYAAGIVLDERGADRALAEFVG